MLIQHLLVFLASPCRISLAWVPWVLCLGGLTASLVLFYPGDYGYDALTQCAQSETGLYGDWHPPVMTALWKSLKNIYFIVTGEIVRGNGLIYVFQTFLLWMGVLTVLVSAKSFWKHNEHSQKTYLSVFVAVFLLSWLLTTDLLYRSRDISKDLSMMGAYLLATGFLLNWPATRWKKMFGVCFILLFLFFGTALRHNAIFALLPMILWLTWRILPKRQMIPLFICGILLWISMIAVVHCFNYTLLKTVPLYPLQERFYADILQLNYRTDRFLLPPNTFGNDFNTLDESLFRQNFQPDVVFIQNAFKEINKELPQYIYFTQNQAIIYPHQEFIQNQNHTVMIEEFRGRKDIQMRVFDESNIRETFPSDYKTLRDTWIERIQMDPIVYGKWKLMVFIKYCQKTSISFWGLSVSTILVMTFCLTIVFTFSQRKLEESVFPFLMLNWSAILYILPLLVFLTDDRELRYVYWFVTASIISLTMFCHESPLVRSLLKKTINYWTMALRACAERTTEE